MESRHLRHERKTLNLILKFGNRIESLSSSIINKHEKNIFNPGTRNDNDCTVFICSNERTKYRGSARS